MKPMTATIIGPESPRTAAKAPAGGWRASALPGLVALLAGVFSLNEFVLHPQIHFALPYTLPVLMAAWWLGLPEAVALAGMALVLDSVNVWMDGLPLLSEGAEVATIFVIAALAIWASEQFRFRARLAREAARVAEERHHEAERLAALAAEQERLVQELGDFRREKDQFLEMVTHEISGALTILFGHSKMLTQRAMYQPDARERSAAAIMSQAERLGRLVNDLRDVSRAERGSFQLRRERCDLVALAWRAVEEQRQVSMRSIQLDTQVATMWGMWDSDRLSQVLANLLRNAVNYTPRGNEVRVALDPMEDRAVLAIIDNGVGITPADLVNLFKPYSRLERTNRVQGTGLGLYISKAIVEAHGGSIQVQSELGSGTTFTVVLPVDGEAELDGPRGTCAQSDRRAGILQ